MVHINKYSVLFLLFFLTGCPGSLLQPASPFPEIKPPKLLLNSGILKLHRKIKIPANGFPETLKLSPDGRYLAVTTQNSEDLIFWDLKTGKKIRAYRTIIKGKNVYKILMSKRVYFFPNSKTVHLSKSSDSYPETYRIGTLLDLEQNKETTFKRSVSSVISNLRFSPDGKYITSSQDLKLTKDNNGYGKIPIFQLIDAKTWEEVASVTKGMVLPMSILQRMGNISLTTRLPGITNAQQIWLMAFPTLYKTLIMNLVQLVMHLSESSILLKSVFGLCQTLRW